MAGKASGLFHPHGATPTSIMNRGAMPGFLGARAAGRQDAPETDGRSSCRGIEVPIARAQQKTAFKANPANNLIYSCIFIMYCLLQVAGKFFDGLLVSRRRKPTL
jgi:hypothetical protein